MYFLTQDVCDRAGLSAYETSNHAWAGAESRHNLIYWRYGDYAGIGPGAHGRLSCGGERWAVESHRNPEAWLSAVEGDGSGVSVRTAVAPAEQAIEMLMMGLRLREGIDPDRFALLSGEPLSAASIEELGALGLIEVGDGRLRTTGAGRPVLDAVLRRLLSV